MTFEDKINDTFKFYIQTIINEMKNDPYYEEDEITQYQDRLDNDFDNLKYEMMEDFMSNIHNHLTK